MSRVGKPEDAAANQAGATCALADHPNGEPLDPRKCVILVPVGSRVEPPCEESLRKLEERGHPVWRVYGYSQLDQARNQLATDALRQGFEETTWIDADIGFQPQDVARLRSHAQPIVSGIYPKNGRRELASYVLSGAARNASRRFTIT